MRDQARLAYLLGGLMVQADPGPPALAWVPTGMVPHNDHAAFTFLTCPSQQGDAKHPRLLTIGLTATERQTHLLRVLPHSAQARQRFFGFSVPRVTREQPKGFTRQGPGQEGRWGEP
jgi:hypothetical protein